MAKRTLASLALGAVFGLFLVFAAPGAVGYAQDDGESASQPLSVDEGLEQVDQMLDSEDEVYAGAGEAYDPGGRRDPFRSLLAARQRTVETGPRPSGIPGLLIDQIELTGIFVTSTGPVAQVLSSEEDRSYLLRVGDQVFDGDVVSITQTEIQFKQQVVDPAAIKPFRDVVKTLKSDAGNEG